MSNIAFIGLGNMGAPMAANLVKAGHSVQGFDLADAAKTAAAVSGVKIAQSAFLSVTIDLCACVKENLQRPPAKDIQDELVANAVHSTNCAPDDGAPAAGQRGQTRRPT